MKGAILSSEVEKMCAELRDESRSGAVTNRLLKAKAARLIERLVIIHSEQLAGAREARSLRAAGLREDAARYRFLREMRYSKHAIERAFSATTPDEMDRVIDGLRGMVRP